MASPTTLRRIARRAGDLSSSISAVRYRGPGVPEGAPTADQAAEWAADLWAIALAAATAGLRGAPGMSEAADTLRAADTSRATTDALDALARAADAAARR